MTSIRQYCFSTRRTMSRLANCFCAEIRRAWREPQTGPIAGWRHQSGQEMARARRRLGGFRQQILQIATCVKHASKADAVVVGIRTSRQFG